VSGLAGGVRFIFLDGFKALPLLSKVLLKAFVLSPPFIALQKSRESVSAIGEHRQTKSRSRTSVRSLHLLLYTPGEKTLYGTSELCPMSHWGAGKLVAVGDGWAEVYVISGKLAHAF